MTKRRRRFRIRRRAVKTIVMRKRINRSRKWVLRRSRSRVGVRL